MSKTRMTIIDYLGGMIRTVTYSDRAPKIRLFWKWWF